MSGARDKMLPLLCKSTPSQIMCRTLSLDLRPILTKACKEVMPENVLMENEEESKRKRGRACDHIRQALKRCLKQSDCVQKEHRHAVDCLRSRVDTVPVRCFQLLDTFAQCKLSLIDNRLRTRGRKLDIPDTQISPE
ncbi:hypothetical protein LOAG_03521 [Loa loa]|uniref:Cytochrome c oxidase assembly factor 5 n=2 Tax=Loa loa TaxID=7209 RepID=A0A1S0U4A6_LOALO|nr:hypothetical protein LOAG_03521 [Loa loa]EFO24964.1 hypothetical protein LOAG_03521 [Loa loa]